MFQHPRYHAKDDTPFLALEGKTNISAQSMCIWCICILYVYVSPSLVPLKLVRCPETRCFNLRVTFGDGTVRIMNSTGMYPIVFPSTWWQSYLEKSFGLKTSSSGVWKPKGNNIKPVLDPGAGNWWWGIIHTINLGQGPHTFLWNMNYPTNKETSSNCVPTCVNWTNHLQ